MQTKAAQAKSIGLNVTNKFLAPQRTTATRVGPAPGRKFTPCDWGERYQIALARGVKSRGAVKEANMASNVLSHPHRFILVSDLDWTMVRDNM